MNNKQLKFPAPTQTVYDIIAALDPWDELEKIQIAEALDWISSGAPIFRVAKPDIPNKHLVSYFVLFDSKAAKILLVDHRKAQLWLPSGGHVDVGEDPKETVKRECVEELGIEAEFFYEEPLFLTSTVTVGLTAGHTDVSLWYVLKGDHRCAYDFDSGEFKSIHWFSLEDIPFDQSDPHLGRFIAKLQTIL